MAMSCDYLVLGSGSAAAVSALRAAHDGVRVIVVEKTDKLGGTSAMSGAGLWFPANHIAGARGITDSTEEALTYIRASMPEGWAETEMPLWRAFTQACPRTLAFIEANTPLEFLLVPEPDPFAERPGGKLFGRMLTVRPLSRRLLGRFASSLRRSTLVHLFAYDEMVRLDPYHHPVRAVLRLAPQFARRWFTNSGGQGTALMTGLLKGCMDCGVEFHLRTEAISLIQDASGRVSGATVRQNGRSVEIAATRGVLIATGGFEWNSEMREKDFPGPLESLGSPSSNAGDGQRMAAEVGASLERMDKANIYPCLPKIYEGRPAGLPFTFTAEKHSILVNRHGQRFVSENDFNIGEALDARDPQTGEPLHLPVWLIGDRRFLRQSLPFHWFARHRRGWVRRAPTIEALARQIGLPPTVLAETVARYNRFCTEGHDLDFNRGKSAWDEYKSHGAKARLTGLEEGPFVALSVNRSILGTKGGARTNDSGQVLRADGSVIPGLYAAGLAMANPIGTRAVGPGNPWSQHDLGLHLR